MKKENGFTLVELIVTLFIGSLMLAAIYTAVNSAQLSSSRVERRVSAQQDARSALELMALEIQMASYNPNSVNIWVDPANCASAAANQNYRGIQAATANSITIEMDLDGSSKVGDAANEIILYNYDTGNQDITRETKQASAGVCTSGNPQPFLGATAAETDSTRTVLVVNNTAGAGNTALPVFRYYQGDGTEITVTNLPAKIPDIRRVEITLVVDTSSSDPVSSGSRRRIIYSTSVIPRNHIYVPAYY